MMMITIFNQGHPTQRSWFKWSPGKNKITKHTATYYHI